MRPSREAPARNGTPVGPIRLPELRLEDRLLVDDHEHVEEDEDQKREAATPMLRKSHASPRMRAMTPLYMGLRVNRYRPRTDEEAWRIDRGEGALARGEEVPDAPEED